MRSSQLSARRSGDARRRLVSVPGQQRGLPGRGLDQRGLPADRPDRRSGRLRLGRACRARDGPTDQDHRVLERRGGRGHPRAPAGRAAGPSARRALGVGARCTWPRPRTRPRPAARSVSATTACSVARRAPRRRPCPGPDADAATDRRHDRTRKGPLMAWDFSTEPEFQRSWTGPASSSTTRSSPSTSSTRTGSSTRSTTSCARSSTR